MKRKIIITVSSAIMLVALYCIIFGFSAQTGEESGSISSSFTERCIEFFGNIAGKNWSELAIKEIASYFEHPVRKLGHFTEYAAMGFLLMMLWKQWIVKKGFLFSITIGCTILLASADEIHQYFVPGRWASPLDVLLDTTGGIAGMLVCLLFDHIYHKLKHRKINTEK